MVGEVPAVSLSREFLVLDVSGCIPLGLFL